MSGLASPSVPAPILRRAATAQSHIPIPTAAVDAASPLSLRRQNTSPAPAVSWAAPVQAHGHMLRLDLRSAKRGQLVAKPPAAEDAANNSEFSPRDSVWKRYFCGREESPSLPRAAVPASAGGNGSDSRWSETARSPEAAGDMQGRATTTTASSWAHGSERTSMAEEPRRSAKNSYLPTHNPTHGEVALESVLATKTDANHSGGQGTAIESATNAWAQDLWGASTGHNQSCDGGYGNFAPSGVGGMPSSLTTNTAHGSGNGGCAAPPELIAGGLGSSVSTRPSTAGSMRSSLTAEIAAGKSHWPPPPSLQKQNHLEQPGVDPADASVDPFSAGTSGGSSSRVRGSAGLIPDAAARTVAFYAERIVAEDLVELSTMSRPPLVVREATEMMLMLLGYRDATWAAARVLFEQPEVFLTKVRGFDAARSVSRLQYQKLCRSVNHLMPSVDTHETRCHACTGIERWCRAVKDLLACRYGISADACSLQDRPRVEEPHGSRGGGSLGSGAASPATSPRPQTALVASAQTAKHSEVSTAASSTARGTWPALGGLEVTPDVFTMPFSELRHVRDLTIRKPNVGEVTFHGEIDLTQDLRVLEDLPSIVRLEVGEVVLYPTPGMKPPEGEGLNRPATVTLFGCMPPNNGDFPDAASRARYRDRIAHMTEQKGARFVDYDCDRGTWRFRVDHF